MRPTEPYRLKAALRSADDPIDGHIIVDPNAIDNKGGSSIDSYVPSLDGTRVAVSISRGGNENVYLLSRRNAPMGTPPGRLAIEGESNGGLLMGAALTQHREQFHAVVSHVGIYDMLRVELQPNGAFHSM